MELFWAAFTKSDLDKIPDDERVPYLMALQLGNDLNILRKQLLWSLSYPANSPDVIIHGGAAMATLNIRVLAGRLHEGWGLLQHRLGRLLRKHETDLPDDASAAWKELNAYFSERRNLTTTIRNKLGFHSDEEVVNEGYKRLPQDEILIDYHGWGQGNVLYYGAELVLVLSLIELSGSDDLREALDRISGEIIEVAGWFTDVIQGLAATFAVTHLAEQYAPLLTQRLNLEGLPAIDEATQPFFCDEPTGKGKAV